MARRATFVSPTGKRQAFEIGKQPSGWTLEQVAPKNVGLGTAGELRELEQTYEVPRFKREEQAAREEYESRVRGQQGFIEALRKALVGRDVESERLREEEARLRGQQFTAPGAERERLVAAGITDPFERQRRIAAAEAEIASRLGGTRGLLSSLGETREQAIERGARGYEIELGLRQTAAERAAQALREALTGARGALSERQKSRTALEKEGRQFQQQIALAQLRESLLRGRPRRDRDRRPTAEELFAQTYGLPSGTTTTRFKNFLREIDPTLNVPVGIEDVTRGQSIVRQRDPQELFRDYLEAQQAIDSGRAPFEQVIQDPSNAPYAHLIKPKTQDILSRYFELIPLPGTE